ncbi:MAG: ammonia-forming cytochrome c nitrite reductase subunit c552 [Actinomycetia bacterium]|nr:ammonia-forming cytochrome c nitrite reductase subunit c552 [Actinomycetes bacterium]
MKKHTNAFVIWGVAVALATGLFALAACGKANKPKSAADTAAATSPETFADVKSIAEVKMPDQYKAQFPEEVATFEADTTPLRPVESYLKIFPFLNTIYAGSAFAKSYDTPRPHLDALSDAKGSARISAKSNSVCYACKSSQYTIAQNSGQNLAKTSFADQKSTMTQTITCYDCHKNYPGSGSRTRQTANGTYLGAIRTAFTTAFATEIKGGRMAPADAACGQCHNEYYFDPKTGEVSMPKELNDPAKIFDFYEKMGFFDHVNPNTGARMLKAQHPEYDMVSSDTSSMHARNGMTCADCHMEKTASGATSHKLTGPLYSAEIRKRVCLSCHTEGDAALVSTITKINAAMMAEITTKGNALAKFTDDLAAANKSGRYSAAQLDPIRAQEREAQWFLDWVMNENSKGLHNPRQAQQCLERCASVTAAGEAALAALSK